MGMLYLHNDDIFITDIIGYDRLKFSQLYTPRNEILGKATARNLRPVYKIPERVQDGHNCSGPIKTTQHFAYISCLYILRGANSWHRLSSRASTAAARRLACNISKTAFRDCSFVYHRTPPPHSIGMQRICRLHLAIVLKQAS